MTTTVHRGWQLFKSAHVNMHRPTELCTCISRNSAVCPCSGQWEVTWYFHARIVKIRCVGLLKNIWRHSKAFIIENKAGERIVIRTLWNRPTLFYFIYFWGIEMAKTNKKRSQTRKQHGQCPCHHRCKNLGVCIFVYLQVHTTLKGQL